MIDGYVKIEGINGESQDASHKGWIELDFLKQHMTQHASATASTAGGHTCERCNHSPLVFSKAIDLSSPKLYENLSSGKTFKEVIIQLYRADDNGERVKYLEIKLLNVMISKISASVVENFQPCEMIHLAYGAVEWVYNRQSIAGGATGNTSGAWSLIRNDKTYTV